MDRDAEIRALTRTLGRITDLHEGGNDRDEKPITATEVQALKDQIATLKKALTDQDAEKYETLTHAQGMLWHAIRQVPGRRFIIGADEQAHIREGREGEHRIIRYVDEHKVLHLLAIDFENDDGTELDFNGIPESYLRNAGGTENRALPLYRAWEDRMELIEPDDHVRKAVDERFGDGSYDMLLEVEKDGESALWWDDIKAANYAVTFGQFDHDGWFPMEERFLRTVNLTHDVKAPKYKGVPIRYYNFSLAGSDFFKSGRWNESEDVLRVINHHYKEWAKGHGLPVSDGKTSYPLFGSYNVRGWRPASEKFLNRIRHAYKIDDEAAKALHGSLNFQNEQFNFADWTRVELENYWQAAPNIRKVILDHYDGWSRYMDTHHSDARK